MVFPEIKEYRLGNGLLVLVGEFRSLPIVSYQVHFAAGSRYEKPGITGISHLFEHMMFKGTPRVGPEEFARIVQAHGGTLNAFTTTDNTSYYENLPTDKLELAVELEALPGVEPLESLAELGPENLAQRPHGEQVVRPRPDPAALCQRGPAACDDAVQVVMVYEGLAPGVQHGGDPQLRSEVVPAKGQERLGGAGKQEVVERLLVLLNERVELVRQSKHQVEVRDRQQESGLSLKPAAAVDTLAAWAVAVAAAVQDNLSAATVGAHVLVRTQQRSATDLHGIERFPVVRGQAMRVGVRG